MSTINLETMTIAEARDFLAKANEVAKLLNQPEIATTKAPARDEHLGWNIVVLDRGFVYVGNVRTEGDWLIIDDAKNIRRWGTENKGLGALKDGPLSETVLDKCPTIRAYRSEVKHLLAVDGAKWSK